MRKQDLSHSSAIVLLLAPARLLPVPGDRRRPRRRDGRPERPLPGVNVTLSGPNLMGVRGVRHGRQRRVPLPGPAARRVPAQGRAPGLRDGRPREDPGEHHGHADRGHPAEAGDGLARRSRSSPSPRPSTSSPPRRRRSRCRTRSSGTSPTTSSRRTSSTWPPASTTTSPTAPRRTRASPTPWTASTSPTPRPARPGSSRTTTSSRRPRSWASACRPSTATSPASSSTW
ncbi:MAG: hypothetical protein MZU79_04035 [Anaerotruncus sp.]|nr:hypothetical protein [Anaerotruncus sp.]